MKYGKEQEKADAFDAKEIFGGEDAANLQKQGEEGVGSLLGVQRFEGVSKRKEIKNKGDEFLVDVCEGDPMLAIPRVNEHKQRGEVCKRFALREDLGEHPPCGDANENADKEGEDLPRKRVDGDDAGCEIENGTQKRTKRHESGDEIGGTEESGDPSEGPIVPIKAGKREQ